MYWLAIKMLIGDKAKFPALVFAVACSAFLISQQVSIFTGLMNRTTSQIRDVAPNAVWVMHPAVRYVDELKALADGDLERVRSVAAVGWAVRFFKGFTRVTSPGGAFRQAILLGVDDASLTGRPNWMLVGDSGALREPDAVIVDDQGYRSLFPGAPLEIGRTLELNDRKARIVGICRVSPPFATFPVIYSRYSAAMNYVGRERNLMTFVLAQPREGLSQAEAAAAITRATGLKALPAMRFAWETILFYVGNTGIPVNFGITITVAAIVGLVITGQTFFLFVVENIRNLAALKAMGAGPGLMGRMILLQALVVGVLGLSIGIGCSAMFFAATREIPKLRLFVMHPEIAIGTACMMIVIALLSCLLALRLLRRLEPAVVFR